MKTASLLYKRASAPHSAGPARQRLNLHITVQDIAGSRKFKIRNPILFVLQHVTKTLWRVADDDLFIEAMAPHRVCRLPRHALRRLREHFSKERPAAFQLEVELHSNLEAEATGTHPSTSSGTPQHG